MLFPVIYKTLEWSKQANLTTGSISGLFIKDLTLFTILVGGGISIILQGLTK